jgi:hypothetical protein
MVIAELEQTVEDLQLELAAMAAELARWERGEMERVSRRSPRRCLARRRRFSVGGARNDAQDFRDAIALKKRRLNRFLRPSLAPGE